ncbi:MULTISPECIES: hypothetical protein [unclassified Massilia]|uniref:hypothetical protein n=1 Tax=unclassified Massilia TaxID=2609279 RepID=UPI001B814D07|nr:MULTISPECIES: hypothetical protein [unclassified Massilia]MBQ5939033.1 hypothetical protein [Massilia sp. AB1]MBQ5962416.1 hypothetical protein [Massilia sp. ZL223]
MILGVAPVLIGLVWMVSGYSSAPHGKVYIAEALMKIGFAYMFALVVSSGSAVWSLIVEKRNTGTRVGGTTAIRLLAAFFLAAPLIIGMF